MNQLTRRMQGRIFKSELKRALSSRGLLIAIVLGMLLLGLGANITSNYPAEKSFVDQWYLTYNHSFYFQMLPLIAAFPFADSLASDRKQGYLERLAVRRRYNLVLSAKFSANAIAGALAGVIPLLLLYLITIMTNHNPLNHPALNMVDGRPYEMEQLVTLYRTAPDVFILLVVAVVFVMGAIFASLGMASTLLVNHRFVALSLPFLLASALQYFANNAKIIPWYLAPSEILLKPNFSPSHAFETTNEIPLLFILPVCMILATFAMLVLFGKRQQVLENTLVGHRAHHSGFSLERLVPARWLNFPLNESRLKHGTTFGNYFRGQVITHIRPVYILFIVIVMMALSTVMLGWMKLQVPSAFKDVAAGLEPNTWDLYFRTMGDPMAMALVIANLFLFLVSNLQPQTAFGQLAVKRLGARSHSWVAHVGFLLIAAILYSLLIFIVIMLTAYLLGMPFSSQWSYFREGVEHINLAHYLTKPPHHGLAFATVFGMTTLGFFSMSLLVLLINTLTQRRLIGYFIVEVLLIASLPLSSIFLNAPPYLQYIPIIRNLVMRFYPFVFRDNSQTWASIYTWFAWLAVLLPATFVAYRGQDYLSHPDSE
ncbi:MAG: hypothetical protein WBI14_06645 [Anaerolineaceae bacterium]